MRVSGAAASVLNAGVVLRAVEDYESIFSAANPGGSPVWAYGVGGFARATWPGLLNTAVGASNVFAAVAGRWVAQQTADGVTRQVLQAGSTSWVVPASRQFSAAGAIPPTVLTTPLYEYTIEVPVRLSVIGAAELQFGICDDNGMVGFLGTNRGIVWSSDPAVAGGALRVRRRMVAAGAIVNEPATSVILDATWRRLGVRYTEGTNPTIEMLIDGVPRFSLAGDANMFTLPGGSTQNLKPARGLSATGAATVAQYGPMSYQIKQL